jgi:hypothetical protein
MFLAREKVGFTSKQTWANPRFKQQPDTVVACGRIIYFAAIYDDHFLRIPWSSRWRLEVCHFVSTTIQEESVGLNCSTIKEVDLAKQR